MNQENKTTENSTLGYPLATIQHIIRADKYNNDIKETFIIENTETKDTHKIKKDSFLEIAKILKEGDNCNYLVNNGWKGSDTFKPGAGLAVKINLVDAFYEFNFYIGEEGELFDAKKIKRKTFMKIEKDNLDAIFTYLIYTDKIVQDKADLAKENRTTLSLD